MLQDSQNLESRASPLAEVPALDRPASVQPGTACRQRPGRTRGSQARDRAPTPRLLGLQDGAAYVGLSYWSFRELVASGVVPSVRVPCPGGRDGRTIRRILVDRQDLDRLIEAWKEADP